jgi:hypothetical protein
MTTAQMTREEWLNRMAKLMEPMFAAQGHPLPEQVRISCGWPSRRALGSKRAVGQCWYPEASADQTTEVFVSPCLDDAVAVSAVMVHELVHAALGAGHGHGKEFSKLAKALGMVGKMTATEAGPALAATLAQLAQQIGAYPHATLDYTKVPTKKQTTRMVKVICPECGYTVRTSQKWIDIGLPTCCCGEQMEAPEAGEGEEGGEE